MQVLQRNAVRIMAVLLIISIAINVLSYLRYSTRRPLVIVGNRAISKYEYQNALDDAAGKAVLNKLVYTEVISQAAESAHLAPTKDEVEARMADMQKRMPQLQSLESDPESIAKFKLDVTSQMELENLRMQGVTVSPSDERNYYFTHREDFTVPAQQRMQIVVTKSAQDAALAEHQLSIGTDPATIAREPGMLVPNVNGYVFRFSSYPLAVQQQIQADATATLPGQVKSFQIGSDYLTLKSQARTEAVQLPFSQVQDKVERAARLAKAPTPEIELAKLYQAAKPKFVVSRYAAYFADMDQFDVSKAMTDRKVAEAQ